MRNTAGWEGNRRACRSVCILDKRRFFERLHPILGILSCRAGAQSYFGRQTYDGNRLISQTHRARIEEDYLFLLCKHRELCERIGA